MKKRFIWIVVSAMALFILGGCSSAGEIKEYEAKISEMETEVKGLKIENNQLKIQNDKLKKQTEKLNEQLRIQVRDKANVNN
ncbi:hypothetical protein JMM81_18415 [Bacillus sp. V3B]|uniref:hypothetical protein n=1 Tax=Bacillus sp. V3B TaxID=2804915 RepID=UPI00210AE77C|nr:hypothetical protein [Bacillus sp. V3B]MCQ6276862.1 hypothetical protein [Bacillus sp. V3B]